jgi:hypothetical protein
MSIYVPPALNAVDFALSAFTPENIVPYESGLSAYTVPALNAVNFALSTYTLPDFFGVDFELLPASPPPVGGVFARTMMGMGL